MATVTGYTAAHMDEIKNDTIVGATVTGDNLILTKFDTTTVNAGNVRGPIGPAGPGYSGVTSTTSLAIGTGSKVFTINTSTSAFVTGARVRAANTATPTNYMEGIVTVSGTTMTMTSDLIGGSGTFNAWTMSIIGNAGNAATIAVGTVTTGSAGSSVAVTNSGSSSAATLNFTIPQGNVGTAATIAVGTVTTGAAGSSVIVTNSGSSSAATFDFTIPKGDTGVGTPTGAVIAFAGASAPTSWLLCDGSLQPKSAYADLWTLIGSIYGTATSTHFYLPDLRGRVAAGKDNMGGTSASRLITNVAGGTLGSVGGTESQGLTAAQVAAHSHPNTLTDPGHTHPIYGTNGVGNSNVYGISSLSLISSSGNHTAISNTTGITITNANNTGTGAAHNNTQPTIILNYIIKT